MSQRKVIGRLAARVEVFRGSGSGFAACGIALVAIGAGCLLEEPTATANYAVAVAFGGLLLIRAAADRRGSSNPCNALVESKRMRGNSVRHR